MPFKITLIFCFFWSFINGSSINSSQAGGSGFVCNVGQFVDQSGKPNTDVLYMYTASNGLRIQLRKNGYSYEFLRSDNVPQLSVGTCRNFSKNLMNVKIETTRFDIDFFNCTAQIKVSALDKGFSYLNYFSTEKSFSNISNFKQVIYENVYPNIDIEFNITYNKQNPLKYNIILKPGSNINDLKFLVSGCETNLLNGMIYFVTPAGKVSENIPLSYYQNNPKEIKAIDYVLNNNVISFSGEVDTRRTFVIDPASSLVWGTYLGGLSMDIATALGSDDQNNIYMGGYSLSTGNIATIGAFQSTLAGNFDMFISKFNKDGQLLWSTYFGGANVDIAYAMAVDKDGTIYITGDTFSTSNVATTGAHQTVYGGGIDDVLLAKFDNTGQRIWATYYGGTEHDIAEGITIDKDKNIIITGHTESTTGIATSGAYRTVYNFNYDVFVAKFSPLGARLWGTYYGDSGLDEGYCVATDSAGNIYVTGVTTSISDISTGSSHQPLNAGSQDAFISKFNSSGSSLIWGTYYGGVSNDFGTVIQVSKNGTVFVGGTTTSSNNIATAGAYQVTMGSVDDSFLAAYTSSGTRLWGTYFGGEDVDYIHDLILNEKSELLFCGATTSTASISTVGAHQLNLATTGFYDAYFAEFSPQGNRMMGTYYGGEGNDMARGITLDQLGRLYIGGETTSSTSIATSASHQDSLEAMNDAFLAKFCIPFQPKFTPAVSTTVCTGPINFNAPSGYSFYGWSNGVQTPSMVVTIFAPGDYFFSLQVKEGESCIGNSDTVKVTVRTCLGIAESEDLFAPKFFPSPTNGFVNVDFGLTELFTDATIDVFSPTGQKIQSYELRKKQNNLVIDLSDYPSGLYFVSLRYNNISVERKIIKN